MPTNDMCANLSRHDALYEHQRDTFDTSEIREDT
jgi:hypothetical protein